MNKITIETTINAHAIPSEVEATLKDTTPKVEKDHFFINKKFKFGTPDSPQKSQKYPEKRKDLRIS